MDCVINPNRYQSFVNKQDKFKDKSSEERRGKAAELVVSAQSSMKELEKVMIYCF